MTIIPTDVDPMEAIGEKMHELGVYGLVSELIEQTRQMKSSPTKEQWSKLTDGIVEMYIQVSDTAFKLGYDTARDPSWLIFKQMGAEE